MTKLSEVISWFEANQDAEKAESAKRFGIQGQVYGITMPVLRKKAKELGKDLALAQALWAQGQNEAKVLASLLLPFAELTLAQAEGLAQGFDSWDVVDQFGNALVKQNLALAWQLVDHWKNAPEEFIKRAAFSLLAMLAVHDKKAEDQKFAAYFTLIKTEASDERNFVKKAVNWALRQIGKRNLALYNTALALAEDLKQSKDKPARWVGQNAWAEFSNAKIIEQVRGKSETIDR